MNKTVSSSNTKAQILDAYDEVMKKLQEKAEDKPKEVQLRKEETRIVESAKQNTGQNIIADITKFKILFVENLETVQDSLLSEHKRLSEIQQAIEIERKNLEELYGLSTNADSFAALLLAQKEKREKFEEDITATKQLNETEMAEAKLKWEKEKTIQQQIIKEEKEQLSKNRKREEEEYKYNLVQNRKKETDNFELKRAKQEAELSEKKLSLEKTFAEREKAIVEKETEFVTLKKESDNFPMELDKTVQNAKVELEENLTKEFKFEKKITSKEIEGLIQLKDLQVSTLENKVKELEAQIKILGQKAETSEKSVKDIAIKAIESSTKVQLVEKGITSKD